MIIRGPRPEGNFYILDKSISEDRRLSWAARGLLVFLLGKPNNWHVSVESLINEVSDSPTKTGKDGSYALLKQLIEAGYARRTPVKGANGRIERWDLTISETPQDSTQCPSGRDLAPHSDKPDQAKPDQAETDQAQPDQAGPDRANTTLISTDKKQELTTEQELIAAPAPVAATKAKPAAKKSKLTPAMQEACRATWDAYAAGYVARYTVEPVFNGKVAGQIVMLVNRIGMTDAPSVAGWFPSHPASYYVGRGHSVDALLKDAEKLRTEWATGQIATTTAAKQSDRRGAMSSVLNNLLAECEVQ